MQVFYSPMFRKRYKNLPKEIRLQAQKKETLFKKNPFGLSLGTHKLHGRMSSLYAFWINKKYRINIAGEGGEYESLVLDQPIFVKKVEIKKWRVAEDGEYNARLEVTKAILKDKS